MGHYDKWSHWEKEKENDFKVNSSGFRSDEFVTLNKNNFNLLYSGDSFTFGYGLNTKHMWSNILTEKIKLIKPRVRSWNVSYKGLSNIVIIKNTMSFIRNYGKPNAIFVMLTEIGRSVYFYDDEYYSVFPPFEDEYEDKKKLQIEYEKHFVKENILFVELEMINMLYDYCKESGIELFLCTWDFETKKQLDQTGLNIFLFERNIIFFDKKLNKNINNDKKWKFALDGYHPGILWNIIVAERIFKEFEKIHN
jgi:hypothetical protein